MFVKGVTQSPQFGRKDAEELPSIAGCAHAACPMSHMLCSAVAMPLKCLPFRENGTQFFAHLQAHQPGSRPPVSGRLELGSSTGAARHSECWTST
jgi:hypothetical protein